MAKITIDEKKCIGCGTCAAMCPSHFIMEGEKSKAVKAEVEDLSCAREAADACPVSAIKIA